MKYRPRLSISALCAVALAPLNLDAADRQFDGSDTGLIRVWNNSATWNPDGFIATGDDLFIGTGTLGNNQTILYSASSYMALSASGSAYTVSPRSVTFDNSLGQFPVGGIDLQNSSAGTAQAGTIRFATPDFESLVVQGGTAPEVLIRSRVSSAAMAINLDYEGKTDFRVSNGGTLTLNGTNTPSSGIITGTGGFRKTGDGLLVLIGSNSFTGGLEITGGTVSTSSNLNLGSGVAPNEDAVVINGGTLRYTNSSVITNFSNRGMKVGEDIGTIELTSGNLRLQNTIGNVSGEAGVLRRTGVAILSIEADTTHTGGTLLESGQISLAGNSTLGGSGGTGIVVSADAILRGSGIINGDSSFNPGSVLMIDQMTSTTGVSDIYGNLLINGDVSLGGAAFLFDLDSPSAADQLGVNGTIDIGSGLLDLSSFTLTAGTNFGAGSYTLFESDALIDGSLGVNLTGMLSGYDISLGISDDGTKLVLTAVPEPAAAMIGGIGMLLLLRRRQRSN